jgi:hypothetical protein
MKLYLVGYDLVAPNRDYTNLYAALYSLGGKRVLESQWVVKWGGTARGLLDHLMRHIDANDRLLVNDFYDWASYNTMISLNAA